MKGKIIDGNIEKAAQKFGVFVIVTTIIFIFGLHLTLKANIERIGRNIERAGKNVRPRISRKPSDFLKVFPQGTFRVDLSQNGGKQLRIAPVKVNFEDKTPH